MSTTLTIEVSDELLEHLRRQSAQQGKTPEALVADYLANLLLKSPDDRLLRWTGSFESDLPEPAQRHAYYLGQALYDELQGGQGK